MSHQKPPVPITDQPPHTAATTSQMDDKALEEWVNAELQLFLKSGDEPRLRHVLREELSHRRAQCDGISCSYDIASTPEGAAAGETLVIAFGGLQQRVGGGHGGGVAPYEFVRACHKAGAKFALFVRDPTRSWYLRGVGGVRYSTASGGGRERLRSSTSFDEMVSTLESEIRHLAPARVVTIGSSMGGYASARAAIALGADVGVAFSPQVLLAPAARKGAQLDSMHFDDLLSWLHVVGSVEGFALTPLDEAAARAAPTGRRTTRIEVHVGAAEAGDVHEAELLIGAVNGRRRTGGGTDGDGGLCAMMQVHPNRDHNLVVALRDSGELHRMLGGWLHAGAQTAAAAAAASASASAATSAAPASAASDVNSEGRCAPPPPPAVARLLAACEARPTDGAIACELAVACVDVGELRRALDATESAVMLRPTHASAWVARAATLLAAGRHVDAVFTLQKVLPQLGSVPRSAAEEANAVLAKASAAQAELGQRLPQIASTKSAGRVAQLLAYETMRALDPTSVYARSEIASARVADASALQDKARQRSRVGRSAAARTLAHEAYAMLHALMADVSAYQAHASRPVAPPTAAELQRAGREAAEGRGGGAAGAVVRRWLAERRPNCPLPPPPHIEAFVSQMHLHLGLACDLIRQTGAADGDGGGAAFEHPLEHYQQSAQIDPQPTWRIFDLLHEALETHPEYAGAVHASARRAAQHRVHEQAVAAGVWGHPCQRPSHYLRGLLARPWHEPLDLAPCRMLLEHYEVIRREALELLRVDADEARHTPTSVFCSYLSQALAAGDWADVGLYYNGMRNDKNARRAPETSKLLCQKRELRRHATSCPFGSAYFSLLRPGTRLSAHCGPTNARLRAHLGLVVPEGDICIRCGDEPPRRWAEGEVLLFDDSFEHEVWNLTDAPRLVLIVDLWHPQLDTDEKRLRAMNSDDERQIYLDVVQRQKYQPTEMRGH